MKIGIMGGTFDPIHLGHLQIAQKAFDQFNLDEVLLIPTAKPPHKTPDSIQASDHDRYEMVKLAIQNKKHLKISDIEMNTAGPAYTIDTLERLVKIKKAEYYLIMGSDSWRNFHTWRKASEIRKKTKIVIADRFSDEADKNLSNDGIYKLKMENCSIASSQIRESISLGKNVSECLPAEVLAYIQKKHLYGWNSICQ